jgi:guanylate cyclase
MKIQTVFAYDPQDTDEIRVDKFAIFLVATICWLAAFIWTAMYYYFFGFSLTTLLPFLFIIIVGSSLLISHLTRNHRFVIYAQIICIIYITALIQWSIGGVFDSGLVMVWAFLGPIIALMFFSIRISLIWLLLYVVNLAITVIFNDYFTAHGQAVSESTQLFFFLMNMSIASVVVFIFAGYFVNSAINEREKANKLLLNVLPKEIAPILKGSDKTIADYYESASVLFADIVGSTPLFSEMEPAEAVDWLNEIFTMFDRLVEGCGLEKIRTIGDNYMVASGVPTHRPDHAQAIAQLALDMIEQLKQVPARKGKRIEFRVGINSGPLVAGVIGQTKFHYDLWGDTVNIASRMESHGEAGRVHITQATYEMIKDKFECVPRGSIPIKGKEAMETWFLAGRKTGAVVNTTG